MKKLLVLTSLIILSSCSGNLDIDIDIDDTSDKNTLEQTTDISSSGEIVFQTPDKPSFSEIDIDFEHNYDKNKALAFLGGTFFDLESDGHKEFIITGGAGENDGVFRYKNGEIIDITEKSGINNTLASYGAYAIDFDENGYDDIFITRQDGIYYYENTSWKLQEKKLNIPLPKNSIPLDIDFADIDGDNDLDMYVSTFINQDLFKAATFNDPNHSQKNILLQNDGNLNFTNITDESGLNLSINTFTSTFADLDGDNDPDIVIATNTDTVRIFENTAGRFTQVYASDIYGFWMWLAISDVDADGDSDIFLSNVGTSIPEKLLQGDSRADQKVVSKYLFLENSGDMKFSEKKYWAFDDLGFGWWIVPTDFNLDEQTDYLIMQNYIKWAPHKLSKLTGELLVQENSDLKASIRDYRLTNKNYGISALVGDLNGDNFDDIIYLNLDGDVKAFLRNTDTKNNFLKINIPNTAKYLLADFEIKAWETSLARKSFIPKQWLMTKQDSSITFGLNTIKVVPDSLTIHYQNGESEDIQVEWLSVINL